MVTDTAEKEMSWELWPWEMKHIGLFAYPPESHFLSPEPRAPIAVWKNPCCGAWRETIPSRREVSDSASRNKIYTADFIEMSSSLLHGCWQSPDLAARFLSFGGDHKQILTPGQYIMCEFTISSARKASSSLGSYFLTCMMTHSSQVLFERVIGTASREPYHLLQHSKPLSLYLWVCFFFVIFTGLL